MRSLVRVALVLALLALVRPASADQAKDFVTAGAMTGFTAQLGEGIYGVLGVEGTYTHYPKEAFAWGLGGFLQAHVVGSGDPHVRAAIGGQVNFMAFGIELGPYVEQGTKTFGTTMGLQACPFASIGYGSLALRVGIPLGALSKGDTYPIDLGLIVTIKWPVPIGGQLLRLNL